MAEQNPRIPKSYRLKARIGCALRENGNVSLTEPIFNFALRLKAASSKSQKTGGEGWVRVSELNKMYPKYIGRRKPCSDSTRQRNVKILHKAGLAEIASGRVRWMDPGQESDEVMDFARYLQAHDDPAQRYVMPPRPKPPVLGRNAHGQFVACAKQSDRPNSSVPT